MKKRVLFFFCFIALLLFPQLVRYTQTLSQRFRSSLNTYIKEKTSLNISYNTVSLKLLNKLVLHDVQLSNDFALIKISHLQIDYSLPALFNDKKNFWQLLSMKNSSIDVQTLDRAEEHKNNDPSFLKQFKLEIMVEESQLHWANANNSFSVAIDYLDFRHSLESATVNFQGTLSSERNPLFSMQSELVAKGMLQEHRANFWLQTQNTQLSRFNLPDIEFLLQIDEQQLSLYDLHSENNLNVDLSYLFAERDLRFAAEFQDLPLSNLREYIPLQPPSELEKQFFTGQVSISQSVDTPLFYSFDLLGVPPESSQDEVPWSIRARGQGDQQNVFFEQLELEADPSLSLQFSGSVTLATLLPQGVFEFAWEKQNIPYLGGKLQLEQQSNSIQIVSEDFSVEQDRNFALVAEMQRNSENSLAIILKAFYENDDFVDLSMNIQLAPEINFLLDFSLPEEGLSVKKFAHFLPESWQKFFVDSFIMGDTRWVIDRQNLDVSWPNFQLKRDDGIRLRAALDWHSGQFQAENINIEIPENASGFTQLFAGNLLGSLEEGDLSGVFLGQQLKLRWSYDGRELNINSDKTTMQTTAQSLKMTVQDFLLPYRGTFVAQMQGDMTLNIEEQWSLDFQNIELEPLLKQPFSPQKIIASGHFRPKQLIVRKLQWWQFDTLYEGQLTFQGEPDNYDFHLAIQDLKEEENLDLILEYRNGQHYSGSSSFQVGLEKLLNDHSYSGMLRSNLEFDWQNTLLIKGDTQLLNGFIKEQQSSFQTDWFYRNGDLLLRNFEGKHGVFEITRGTLLFNEKKKKLVLNTAYQINFNDNDLFTTLNFDLDFIEPVSLLHLQQGLKRIKGQLDIAPLIFDKEELLPALRFSFEKDAKNIRVYETFYNSLRLEKKEGVLDLLIQSPFPFEATLKGFYQNAQLNADLNIISPSILFANNFIPKIYKQKIATITQGRATATLKVEGTLADPFLSGNIQINDFLFSSPYLQEEPQVTQLSFGVKDHVVLLNPSRLQFERGELNFPGFEKNYFIFKNFALQRYFFEIRIGDQGLPVSYKREQISSEGIVLGHVVLKKQNGEHLIDGNIAFRDLLITLTPQEKKSFSYTPLQNGSDFNVNLQVTTGKNFIFERVPFLYAHGQANDTLKIYFSGADNTGTIKGKLNFPTADLNLGYSSKGRGEVILDEKLPQFNPLLSFSSFEQVYQRGTPVAITLSYQGFLEDVLDEENFPEITSDPEIPENEAKILLLSKQTAVSENAWLLLPNFALQAGENSLLRSLSTFLERNISFIDLLDIQTRIASNILLDEQLLTPIDSPEKRFLRYLDESSVTLSKYINRNNTVLLSAGFSMEYNLDERSTELNFNGLQIVPELGLTFMTPLVTIGMGFGLNNTQQLFIPESSLEVSLGLEI